MRIVAGVHRSRNLMAPKGQDIRPTSDKVRQAIFNALQHRGAVADAVVLDAFAGSGALGLEALSQGAQHCVFMDMARESLRLSEDNARYLKETPRCTFLLGDTLAPGARPAAISPITLLFLDPPYRYDLVPDAFEALVKKGWLAEDCVIVAEAEKAADLSALPGVPTFNKLYGDTRVVITQR